MADPFNSNDQMNKHLVWLVLLLEVVLIGFLLFAIFSVGYFIWRVLA